MERIIDFFVRASPQRIVEKSTLPTTKAFGLDLRIFCCRYRRLWPVNFQMDIAESARNFAVPSLLIKRVRFNLAFSR